METISYQTGGSHPPMGGFLEWQMRIYEAIWHPIGLRLYEINREVKDPDKNAQKKAFKKLQENIDTTTVMLSRQLIDALLHHLTAFDGDTLPISRESLWRATRVLAYENRIAEECPEFGERVVKPLREELTQVLLAHAVRALIEGGFFTHPTSFVTRFSTGRIRRYLIQRTVEGIVITTQATN